MEFDLEVIPEILPDIETDRAEDALYRSHTNTASKKVATMNSTSPTLIRSKIKFGAPCNDSDFCEAHVQNSSCRGGVCKCGVGFRLRGSSLQCTPIERHELQIALNEACNWSSDCEHYLINAKCINYTCQCPENYKIFKRGDGFEDCTLGEF